MKNSLFYSLLVSLLSVSLGLNAQCDLPESFSGNTGANMTVMLTSALISSLNITEENAYIVALSEDSLVVGSTDLFGVTQTSIAVWGNDSQTTEIDGAFANESISFQLVNGMFVFDVEMPSLVSYTTNGMAVQTMPAVLTSNCTATLGCTDDTALNYDETATVDDGSCIAAILGCTDGDAENFNINANTDDGTCVGFCVDWMLPFNEANQTVNSASILLSETYVLSLNTQSASAYIVGVTPANLVVGSSVIGQTSQQLALWPDDTFNADIVGAVDGETISFYLVDDESLYLLSFEYVFVTSGMTNIDIVETPLLTCIANTPFGCLDSNACNYSSVANTDDGSCISVDGICDNCVDGEIVDNDSDNDGVCDVAEIAGCQDNTACNFNENATDAEDSCIYSIDLDDCASCSGEQDGTGVIVDNDSDDDSVCDTDEVLGCQDNTACNFNENATDTEDLCVYSVDLDDCASCSGEQDGTGVIVDNDSDDDSVCDADEVLGCQDNTACNFNENATDAEDLCVYSVDLDVCATCSGKQDGTGTIVDNDLDNDSVCNQDEIIGCTDVEACNYDSNSTTDTDNSLCEYIDGCQECSGEIDGSGTVLNIDPSICAFTSEETFDLNYDPILIQNSEADSLVFVSNMIDMLVTQLDLPEGTVEIIEIIISEFRAFNVQIIYEVTLSEVQITDLNLSTEQIAQNLEDDVNQLALVIESSGSSFDFVEGCTNSEANNFDPLANINDGSCEFTNPGCGVQGACNYNPELDAQYSDFNLCVFIPLNHFCTDSLIGDSLVFYDGGCINDINLDGICDETQVVGCTDTQAFNYNVLAILEDESCVNKVLGCIENTACNYNASANTDDETCDFAVEYYNCNSACLSDVDSDGVCDQLEIPDRKSVV